MILIAESDSTKCDWVLLGTSNDETKRIRTKGLNPAILKKKDLKKNITDNKEFSDYSHLITLIYFFGAGCNTPKSKNNVQLVLSDCFKNATSIVEEDTMAAVYATTKTPAVVCILGTGSNCCYFNGTSIHSKTPNKYLASFAIFLFENIAHSFMKKIVDDGMARFIENHILQYSKELETVPLHFVGSIAFYAKEYIEKQLNKRGLNGASFVQRPIDNLIERIKKDHLIS